LTIHIVPIAERHIAGFHAVLDRVARQRKYLALVEAPPLEAVRELVLRHIGQAAPHVVAIDGGAVVGWCDIVPDLRESSRHCGRLAMGVDPDYRGRGIGRRLLRAALAAARARGLERIELNVVDTNEIAIRLYKRFGFEEEGLLRNARKLDGQYDNKLTMGLLLNGPGTTNRSAEKNIEAAEPAARGAETNGDRLRDGQTEQGPARRR
jgi:ribosomal protein S18 acetylase RimI-like enzyme